jgi:UDP-GlcNAc:undecaprenyl-phosphate GlcNAc-1-phosphate transferase
MLSSLIHIICLGLVAFVATFVLAPVSKKLSVRLDAIDYPSKRRINTYPVPRLGGFALFGGLLIAMIFEVIGERLFAWQGFFDADSLPNINYLGVMSGVAFIVLVGGIDDVRGLRPGIKFMGQIIAASIIAFSGVLLSGVGSPFGSEFIGFGWISYPLTILYLVAFANIINLVDGLDGLASGIVSIVALGLFYIAFSKGRMEAVMFAVVLVAICLAFLRYNRHPASLYMGDSGALMLGTLLGIVSLIGAMRSPTVIALIVPIIFAGFPVLDTLFAIIRRVRRKQPVQLFDTDHFHHVLLRSGFSHQQVVRIICVWTALLTGGGMLISNIHGIAVYALFALLALISIFLIWRLDLYTSVLRHHYDPRVKPSDTSQTGDPSVDAEANLNFRSEAVPDTAPGTISNVDLKLERNTVPGTVSEKGDVVDSKE